MRHERDSRFSLRFGKRGDRRRDVVRDDVPELIPPVLHSVQRRKHPKDVFRNPPFMERHGRISRQSRKYVECATVDLVCRVHWCI